MCLFVCRWTEIYITRLKSALGPEYASRLHVIDRVSSEQFLGLIKLADVVLHPFPFDGSRTSADSLIAGESIYYTVRTVILYAVYYTVYPTRLYYNDLVIVR